MRSTSTSASPARALAACIALVCALGVLAAPPATAGPSATGADDGQPSLSLAAPVKPLPGGTPGWAAAGEEAEDVLAGSLLVTTRGLSAIELRDRLPAAWHADLPAVAVEQLAGGVARLRVSPRRAPALRAALAAVPGVLAVDPEREWAYAAAPDDPDLHRQWAHDLGDARAAWAIATGSRSTVVAVLDSGIDGRHPELADRIAVREVVGPDAGGRLGVRPGEVDNDACGIGHGTMVAGVAGAAGNNGIGVAGVAWDITFIDIALSSPGSCSPTDAKVVAALGRIASGDHGRVDVVNLSLGGREPLGRCPSAVQSAIDQVVAGGTVVVAAAGNESSLDLNVPAACRGVIAVGAVDSRGARASYSSSAPYLDVAAPGGDSRGGRCTDSSCILTTAHGGGDVLAQGTSFAAPYVSGVVALLRSLRPGLTPAQVESLLEVTARQSAADTHDQHLGWGRVQAGAALRHLRDGRSIPAPRTHPAGRIAQGTGRTVPITQAVAVSQATFADGKAMHAVIAREDDFADALAGSSLAYGIGPLLFARRSGALPAETAAELRRTLTPGRVVYLLGGTAALDARLEADIRALGLTPQRLSGPTREHTAVAVARALRSSQSSLGITPNPVAVVATRANWPDAVAAGSLGAAFGVPILLTPRNELHPATAAYLAGLGAAPDGPLQGVYLVGGDGVVSDATARAASAAARTPLYRLSGATRAATAVAVAEEMRRQLDPATPPYAITIDLDRPDSFAHALSASVLAGSTMSVFLPVRGVSAPQRLTDATAARFCGNAGAALLAGDHDLLPAALGEEIRDVLAGTSPRC